MGHYAFLWGQKQERTPTWYGMFVGGKPTAAVHTLSALWTGAQTEQAPAIERLELAGGEAVDSVMLMPGQQVKARVYAADDGLMSYRWALWQESQATQSGGDLEEAPPQVEGAIAGGDGAVVDVRAPLQSGAYRLFVYIEDEQGNVAHANLPFFVKDKAGETGQDE